jgi:hypothetical protein
MRGSCASAPMRRATVWKTRSPSLGPYPLLNVLAHVSALLHGLPPVACVIGATCRVERRNDLVAGRTGLGGTLCSRQAYRPDATTRRCGR